MKVGRRITPIGFIMLLASCQESVEERAEAAGCPNLEREVGMLFVRAGVSDGIQKTWEIETQRYGVRRTPLAYSNAGLRRSDGEASSAAVKSLFDLVGYNSFGMVRLDSDLSEVTSPEEIGTAIVDGLKNFPEEYRGKERRIDYFQRCSTFVGEYLSLDDKFQWANNLYENPEQ
ncbi:MAG: hypothetical protein V2I43_14145 [Parvularcula sp.]|jgi:hypothetical protein|nr:hypothetical protein [Parvularcula sp.]